MEPLRFKPIFKDYIWGGDRLAKTLNKPTGPGVWAESWEIVDHKNGQSIVEFGEYSGQSLRQLIEDRGQEILGKQAYAAITAPNVPDQLRGRFPLLLKFLDANRVLSVQVHPDDSMGATLTPPDLGKTEAWYVIDATPDAKIYAGLKPGVTESDFRQSIAAGRTEDVLHSFTPMAGDCVFIRAGTVHAIGAGLMVCEIQQASDTTFRLFDWNRVGNDGQPRPLHIEQGIAATHFGLGPVDVQTPALLNPNVEQLVKCDKFILNRWSFDDVVSIGGDGKFRILAVIEGAVNLETDPSGEDLNKGGSVLLPAASDSQRITPRGNATMLEITLP